MRVTIRNRPQEILIHTVSTKINLENPDNIYLFRCYRCGTNISQVKGDIVRIAAGREPTDSVDVITQCYKCREYYTFQTKDYLPSGSIKLILSCRGMYNLFECVFCREELLEFSPSFIESVPDHIKRVMPYDFQCPTSTCKFRYTLVDLL